ncbi:hypothetical protein H4CHR_04414 [Variovorax sp. PBS-H4]|uniref:YdaU family protein n=1 Tax=Variovorax sp. PBS-H4 TaxID=434008 RepID=UPI001318FE47|nr:YdaU family protein [Variovorax sp. PBS-H4]VTU38395.1 hypothetical protein H4CHR_04414 [Variovorax sp. PBS-H4]
MSKPVPYPSDTRAKGWRFELDHEKIEQSDTWALAPAELRPWLLMLWMTAWRQEPCGSLPADDELIAAKIGMPLKAFAKVRAKLMRGWWPADDGRLYHDTLTLRVTEMMTRRRSEADRKARARAKQTEGLRDSLGDVPDLSRGTSAGLHPESDTGTGTGTGTYTQVDTTTQDPGAGSGGGGSAEPTKAGAICRAIKAKGVASGINPSNPELLALIDKGVPVETFEAAAEICAEAKPPKGFAYLLGIVKRQLGEAAVIASGAGMPVKPWDDSRSSIEAKGIELGLGMWNANDLSASRETFQAYTARVRRAVEALAGEPA